jgi:hypothetical protein
MKSSRVTVSTIFFALGLTAGCNAPLPTCEGPAVVYLTSVAGSPGSCPDGTPVHFDPHAGNCASTNAAPGLDGELMTAAPMKFVAGSCVYDASPTPF